VKILRLLWEIIIPFDIEWSILKQQALQTPDHAHLTAVNVADIPEPLESQAGNEPGNRVAA
jgi:hypothetical protein